MLMVVPQKTIPLEPEDWVNIFVVELLGVVVQEEQHGYVVGIFDGGGGDIADGLLDEGHLDLKGNSLLEAVELDLFGEEDHFYCVDTHPGYVLV